MAACMEYGMSIFVALAGGCSQLLFFSFLSNGTSMISLIIPPKDQISRVAKMLADEFGTASNIKSRVNRLSVLGAITSVQQRLKLYNKGNFQLVWMLANFPYLEAALSSCIVQFSANEICWPVLLFCTDIPGMLPTNGYFRGRPWDQNSKMVL